MITKRYLLITVDTEEEFDWSRTPFPSSGGTVKNINELRQIQKVFAELNAKATYFVDFPVLKGRLARDILKEFYEKYGAEIGSHLHPWCTPPFEEQLNPPNTMATMLPTPLLKSKMEVLTESFIEAFGFRPLSYRAGRFSFDGVSAKIIDDLGYKIDSSITPFYDWSNYDGPDFFFAHLRPYFIDGEDLFCEDKNGKILEVPISAGFNRVPFKFWSKIYWSANHNPLRSLKLLGALHRTNLLKLISLSPESESLEDMKALVKNLCCEGIQVFNMMFHSSSLLPGGTSFSRTALQVSIFEKNLTEIVSWMVRELKFESILMSDLLRLNGGILDSALLSKEKEAHHGISI